MRPNLNPLHTSFHPSATPRPQDQPTTSPTRSPTSPATTASISSPSPPTSPFYHPRRPNYHHIYGPSTTHRGRPSHPINHNISNTNNPSASDSTSVSSPSPSPGPSPRGGGRRRRRCTGTSSSPFRLSASSLFSLVGPQQRTFLLRRRPSRAEVALSEERYRAEEDRIERAGLDLLEPRPGIAPTSASSYAASAALGIGGFDDLDSYSLGMSMDGAVQMDDSEWACCSPGGMGSRWSGMSWGGGVELQQRVVMGGIFEVMEGRG